jgi:D-alanyl-D-alanine carboxypeptidase
MGILGLALLRDFPHYYSYFSRQRFYFGGTAHPNHNRLLGAYPGMDGIKTGYTRQAGFNLVGSAHRDGRRIIAVVLGAPSPLVRNNIISDLLEQGFRGDSPIRVASIEQYTGHATASDHGAVELADPTSVATSAFASPAPPSQYGSVASYASRYAAMVAPRAMATRSLAWRPAMQRTRAAPPMVAAIDRSSTRCEGKRPRQVCGAERFAKPVTVVRGSIASASGRRPVTAAAAPARVVTVSTQARTSAATASSPRTVSKGRVTVAARPAFAAPAAKPAVSLASAAPGKARPSVSPPIQVASRTLPIATAAPRPVRR